MSSPHPTLLELTSPHLTSPRTLHYLIWYLTSPHLTYTMSGAPRYSGEGDMFEGGGLMEGLEVVRTPLLSDPPEEPTRPDSVDADALWALLLRTLARDPAARPTFGAVAREVGEIRQAAAGRRMAGGVGRQAGGLRTEQRTWAAGGPAAALT